MATVGARLAQALLRPDSARTIFGNVRHAMEDIATELISLALPSTVPLTDTFATERDPSCLRWCGFCLTTRRGRSPTGKAL